MSTLRKYWAVYSVMLRNSLIREMNFKLNFLLWMIVESLWFVGQVGFIEVFFSHVDQIGDWTTWPMVQLVEPRDRRNECSSPITHECLGGSMVADLPSPARFSADAFGFQNPLAIRAKPLLERKFLKPASFPLHRYPIASICS